LPQVPLELLSRLGWTPDSTESCHERGIRTHGTPYLCVPQGESLAAKTKRFDAIEVHWLALMYYKNGAAAAGAVGRRSTRRPTAAGQLPLRCAGAGAAGLSPTTRVFTGGPECPRDPRAEPAQRLADNLQDA
jgi:hypothetical protein